MRKAHSIGGQSATLSPILWPKAHIAVKQTLKNLGDDISPSKHLDDFKYIGESVNEDKIVISGERTARSSIKGHYPAKDGVAACLPATEAVDTRGGPKELLGLLNPNGCGKYSVALRKIRMSEELGGAS